MNSLVILVSRSVIIGNSGYKKIASAEATYSRVHNTRVMFANCCLSWSYLQRAGSVLTIDRRCCEQKCPRIFYVYIITIDYFYYFRGHDFRLVILLSNTASGWWIDKPVARSLWACRPYCDRSGRPYRAVSLPSRAAAGKGGRTPPSDPRPSQAPATFIYCYTYLLTLGFRPLFKFGFVFRVE